MKSTLDIDDVSYGHPVAEEELLALRLAERRYETIRRLTPRQFTELYARNLTGEPFDQLVDARDDQEQRELENPTVIFP